MLDFSVFYSFGFNCCYNVTTVGGSLCPCQGSDMHSEI